MLSYRGLHNLFGRHVFSEIRHRKTVILHNQFYDILADIMNVTVNRGNNKRHSFRMCLRIFLRHFFLHFFKCRFCRFRRH